MRIIFCNEIENIHQIEKVHYTFLNLIRFKLNIPISRDVWRLTSDVWGLTHTIYKFHIYEWKSLIFNIICELRTKITEYIILYLYTYDLLNGDIASRGLLRMVGFKFLGYPNTILFIYLYYYKYNSIEI